MRQRCAIKEAINFVKSNIPLVSAIGYHRIKMKRRFHAVLTYMVSE